MNPIELTEGNIISITENGIEKYYITDAPYVDVSKMFFDSLDLKDFIETVEENGYRINEYRPSMRLNFHE